MEHIENYFDLKGNAIVPPEIHVVGRLLKFKLGNDVKSGQFGSTQYVRAAVENVKGCLKVKGIKLPVQAKMPIQISY